jgi:hypothetical protein
MSFGPGRYYRLAGLVPAIHVFTTGKGKDVDARQQGWA